jgi:aminopeptidase N
MHTIALHAAAWAAIMWLAGLPAESRAGERDRYHILYTTKLDAAGEIHRMSCPRALIARGEEGASGFDILHYRIDISIDPGTQFVSGTVTATFRVAATSLDSIFFHLKDNMVIHSVVKNEVPLSFLHAQDMIMIALDGAYLMDETLTVEVAYDGFPVPQGLRFYSAATYNLSEPDRARNWFPCYDEPWDKATSEMIVTVPDTLFCASNGLLLAEWDNLNGTKTYQWQTNYRHSTYLISVAISDYVSFSHWYHFTPTDSMEMPYYVYPHKLGAAQIAFSHAPNMMEFFAQTFGQYPFISEKYGTALAPLNGAMENFTCTTYGAGLTWVDFSYDWVVAHEMAHSWFGNCVTMDDWRDIWLNEGFATYGDALWYEHFHGEETFDSRMAENREDYFYEDETIGRFPIYDPVEMWGSTVYKKGAWILHMLRYLTGDSAFVNSLRSYHSAYAYQSASTEDFKAVVENESGMDLSGFFSQWVYQAGYPEYEFSWSSYYNGVGFDVDLDIVQVQSNAPVFTIPVEILVSTSSGDSLLRLSVDGAAEMYHFVFSEQPIALTFDPGNGILKKVSEIPTAVARTFPPQNLSARVFPNPSNHDMKIEFFLPRAGDVQLTIYDAGGRLVERIAKRDLPAKWNSIALMDLRTGAHIQNSGVYFYRLKTARQSLSGKFVVIR